ncbi:MAG: hypothetical protein JF595_08245 [Sphingomonadales bacterium]|nr:hypothetical protein [Sphingomonadales bacterium]
MNDMEFGMTAQDVQKRMSGDFESFVMGGFLENFKEDFPTDYYKKEGILCFYDKSGHLEGMQFYEPSRPTLGGVNLLSLPIGQAISFLQRLDPDLINTGGGRDGAVSRRLNVAVRSFDMDEDDQVPVGSVVVAAPGYYDFLDEMDA